MRHSTLRLLPILAFAAIGMAACNDDDDTWDKYEDWRVKNEAYFEDQKYNGGYATLSPAWNSSATILIRYLNDRSKTEGNLSPMLNSTVDVKYKGWYCNDVPFDSSYTNRASYGDSLFRTQPASLIAGWQIALLDMRCGDSARIVVPYWLGYGSSSNSITPYSTLVFDLKLVDIPFYEVRPRS